jgi:hypothetical protein
LHHVRKGSFADVSEVTSASIFRVDFYVFLIWTWTSHLQINSRCLDSTFSLEEENNSGHLAV